MDQFWIVSKTDDATRGLTKGNKTQTTIAGPFEDYCEAINAKRHYTSYGSHHWHTVVASKKRPPDTKEEFEFIDADREFDFDIV